MADQVLKFPRPPRDIVIRTDEPHEPLRKEIERVVSELQGLRTTLGSEAGDLRSNPIFVKLDQILEGIAKKLGVIAELERKVLEVEEWAASQPSGPGPNQ